MMRMPKLSMLWSQRPLVRNLSPGVKCSSNPISVPVGSFCLGPFVGLFGLQGGLSAMQDVVHVGILPAGQWEPRP